MHPLARAETAALPDPSASNPRMAAARPPQASGSPPGRGMPPAAQPTPGRALPAAARDQRRDVPKDGRGQPAFGPVKRFGEYTLIKKLATGGMAEIWLARQTGIAGFARFLVVKKILAHLAEQETFVRMFQDEARTSAMLSHPNVVQIHDLGNKNGTYYIAMEYIAGENLAAIAWRGMKRGRPIPPEYAARIISEACKALHYAHTLAGPDGRPLDIVHRDVSPQNILVTYEGSVKVVDFGIAKAATKTEHTKTGMLKGKFSYMSPEQCLGAPVDHRSDIFALGILLYELCTGKRLYKHESELMILDMITKRSVVPPSQVSPDIAGPLEDIIMRALEKPVEDRFQSAREMQIALEDYLRTAPLPVNDAEISDYMHTLFADKIEEKRKLRERASRDDFEALFLDDEATEQGRRRTVFGATGNQIQVMGAPGGPPGYGIPPHPAFGTGAMPAQGSVPGTYPGYGQHEVSSPWSRIISVGAFFIIIIAGVVLWRHQSLPEDGTTVTRFDPGPSTPPPPVLTGGITLESSPNEATIYLDGEPMQLAGGGNAVTTSDLNGLQYGRKYVLTLKKDDYRPETIEIEMGEDNDGRTFHPTLEPFPGRLRLEVHGGIAAQTTVEVDGKEVGSGPSLIHEAPGNATVLVEASQPGRVCTAEPRRPRVLPNQTIDVNIECALPTARAPSRSSARSSRRSTASRKPAALAPPKPAGGCVTLPDLDHGFVTIDTRPYATIYWGDRKLGETPLSKQRLPAGCVELRAVTADGKSRTVKVEVKPSVTRTFRFEVGGS